MAVPVGPVFLLVVQKTLNRGRFAGIMAGLGSAFADTIFAAIGLLTLAIAEDFIAGHREVIMIAGGILIVLLGLGILVRPVPSKLRACGSPGAMSLFGTVIQTAGTALSNPGALAYMLGVLSLLGLGAGRVTSPVWALLFAVITGELLYWTFMVLTMSRFLKIGLKNLTILNRIAGTGIVCFGLVLFLKGLFTVI